MSKKRQAPKKNDDELSDDYETDSSSDSNAAASSSSASEDDGDKGASSSSSASNDNEGSGDVAMIEETNEDDEVEEEDEDKDGDLSEGGGSGSSSSKDDGDDDGEEHDGEVAMKTSTAKDDNLDKESDSNDEEEEEEDSGSDDDENDNSNPNEATAVAPPAISKSWTALTTHSPCYTGGTVAFSHAPTSLTTNSSSAMDENEEINGNNRDIDNNTNSNSNSNSGNHFLLAQRGGDVAIIEASTGLLLRTVRRGKAFQGGFDDDLNLEVGDDDGEEDGMDEDDEESMDAEAITAFALSPNNVDMIAVTRGHLVRKYCLAVADDDSDEAKQMGVDKSNDADATNKSASTATRAKQVDATQTHEKPNPAKVTALTTPAKVTSTFGKSGHKLPVTKMAFHESGIFFATGSVDGLVKVWDVRHGYATHALYPTVSSGSGGRGRYAVTCLSWRSNATCLILAIGREDGSVSIHDLLLHAGDTKKASLPLAVMRDHVSAVTCVAWSEGGGTGGGRRRKHGGGVFFSSGRDSVINTWSISEEEVEIVPDAGKGPKRKKKKASKDDDGAGGGRAEVSVRVTYCRIRTLPVYEQVESMILLSRRFRPVSETKDQQEVLDKKDIVLSTCGTKGVVRLWKASHTGSDGPLVVSELSLLASQSEKEAFGEDNGGYTSLHLTSLSTTHWSPLLVVVDAEHNMTYLRMGWKGSTLVFSTDRSIVGHNGEILDLSVVPKGDKLVEEGDKHTVAVATNSSQVRLFGLSEAKEEENEENNDVQCHTALSPRGMLDGHTAIVLSIDASPCGRYLATAGKDKTMRLWHIESQKCIGVATGHTEAVGSVALSRKIGCYDVGGKAAENGAGSFAVTSSKDRTLKVWPLPGSAVMNRYSEEGDISLRARLSARAHDKEINIVSVAPNDSLIASGSQDKTVKLWRATDLGLHGTLKGHKRGIWDCQFSPHDRVLATASGDRTLKLWSIADCSCVRTFQGHMAGVLRVRFLVTGLQLVSSGSDGLIKLWTIRTNECESTIDAHNDKVWALDLSPCGTALFSGGADSKIAVWRDTTKEKDDAMREAEEKNILMEQKLSNHLRHKQYEEALDIALELDKPNQVLRVLTEIVEKDAKSNKGLETLQRHAVNWPLNRLTQILRYCREWNTRARNSHIAMLVVKAVVTKIPAAKLASYEGIPEIFACIAPYAERHFDRLDGLVGSSYLLDFTLFSMGSLHCDSSENYSDWVQRSKFVLPPKAVEGKVQIGGSLVVGAKTNVDDVSESSEDEIVTIGESDSDEE